MGTGPSFISAVLLIPLVGAVVLAFVPRHSERWLKGLALVFSIAAFGASLAMAAQFEVGEGGMQLQERLPWIPQFGIYYHVGVDGLSLFLVLLITFLTPVCILASFRSITQRVKEYMVVFMALEMGMLGVFVALDMFLFYVFWEAMLIPMYLVIGVWGGPQRIYAAVKFFIYTLVGSLLMLVAIIYLGVQHRAQFGEYSFALSAFTPSDLPVNTQMLLFAAFALAFAIKVPMFPFHTWLPDAHVEAPTAGSVMLAGILLKMGTYGFLRFCLAMFPGACYAFAPLMKVLAIVGIIYGGLVCLVQPDLKKLVAYSSVSHLGFVMLGVFSFNTQALTGAVLQMVNHGISTGALFLIVGVLYDRRHTRMIADYGGIAARMPAFAAFFTIFMLSSLALPGTNGFVGEWLILLGAFKVGKLWAVFAATGVALSAIYLLWMYQRVMHGKLDKEENRLLPDVNFREFAMLAPLVIMVFWIGLYPKPFLTRIEPSVRVTLEGVAQVGPLAAGKQLPFELAVKPVRAGVHE